MARAQSLEADAAAAARSPAAGQRGLPAPAGTGHGDERVHAGLALGGPPLMVAGAQSPASPRCPRAAGHPADRAAEHRVRGIEGQLIGPELRADRGHQLLQQAGRNPVLAGPRRRPGRSPAVLLLLEDGRGDADRDAAADTAGMQVNRRPARGRDLGDLVQPQCLLPLREQPAPARRGTRTWPDRAPPDAVTVHAITGMPGCASRMAASSAAARCCQRDRSACVIQPPVTTTPPSR